MSLERLLEKIEDDARLGGRGIVDAAKQEAERITAEGGEEARRAAAAIRKTFRERGERERTKIMSEALAESRAAFLAAQDKLFEEAFTEAMRLFEDLPEERYRAWLLRIISENVTSGDEVIVAAPYDRRLLEDGLLAEVNKALAGSGRTGKLSLAAEEADFERGVILTGQQFVNNLSLDTLMREVRDEYEEEVLKMLFGEADVRGATHEHEG
ncbi:MAG: V-type ATP synthase subunit E [Actinomycetota bacterium]